MNQITREELKGKLDRREPVTLLEALPEKYYVSGHLPGAKMFPQDPNQIASQLPDRSASIVVYCASDTCKNSHTAADTLTKMGYSDVRVYVAGKKDWETAGLPLER